MPDLIAAADVVLGKPGYGLASECVTHRTPFAMIDRPNFRETPLLVEQLKDMGRCATMSIGEFFSGDWEGVLARAQVEGSDWADIDRAPEDKITSRILELIAD
jgi:L-arabinokinase